MSNQTTHNASKTNEVGDWLSVDQSVREAVLEFSRGVVEDYQESGGEEQVPRRMNQVMNVLSAAIGLINIELGPLEAEEAGYFNAQRHKYSSDKQTSMHWMTTKAGRRQIQLKYYLKAIDKIQSACKSTLRRMEMEARNQY